MGVKININTQCGIAANYFMEQLTSVEEKSFYWPTRLYRICFISLFILLIHTTINIIFVKQLIFPLVFMFFLLKLRGILEVVSNMRKKIFHSWSNFRKCSKYYLSIRSSIRGCSGFLKYKNKDDPSATNTNTIRASKIATIIGFLTSHNYLISLLSSSSSIIVSYSFPSFA